MKSDVALQIEELNMLLRYVVERANLNPTEREALRGFLMDVSGRQTAAAIGRSQQAVAKARGTAFDKMRRELRKLGVQSATQLLFEFDESRPEEPENAAIWTPRKPAEMDRQQRKLAFAAAY